MTGQRIKILKSKEPSGQLGLRLKRWFERISAWFKAPAATNPHAPKHGQQMIRIIRSTNPSGSGATPTPDASRPNRPTPSAGASGQPAGGQGNTGTRPALGIVLKGGERICKACGDPLSNGYALAECSASSAHKIHRGCIELAGYKCPDCQTALR
jgi:hypothetical protein